MGRVRAGVAVVAVMVIVVGGCGDDDPGDGGSGRGRADIRFEVETSVAFEPDTEPVALAALPDGGVLVGERRTGVIREIGADGELGEPVHRVDVQADADDQRGLLGLVVADDDRIYGSWTRASDGRLVVAELTDGVERIVWEGLDSNDRANGGHLGLLPDGRLLVGIGDLEDPDAAADPDTPNGKLLALDPGGPPDQGPEPLSQGWNNPFAFVVTDDGAVWVADNAPGDDPERLGRGDRRAPRTDLPGGQRAPSALVQIDQDHLGLCGYLDGEMHLVTPGDEPEVDGVVTTDCRTGAVSLADDRLAVSDGQDVHLLARQ